MPINPVGTWDDSDFETQTGTVYKTNLDNNLAVGKRLTDAFAPHAKASPDMNVLIDAGPIFADGVFTEKSQQTVGPFSAPVSNPRIDRIVIDAVTGDAEIVAGTEAGSPTAPNVPDEKIPVCQIALTVGMVAITNLIISDERISGSVSVISVKDRVTADVTLVSNSSEVDLYSKSIVANLLGSNKVLFLELVITEFDMNASDDLQIRFKYGATTLATIQLNTIDPCTAYTNATGLIRMTLFADGATDSQIGVCEVIITTSTGAIAQHLQKIGTSAIDGTMAQDLKITGDFNTNSANNKIVIGRVHLRKE